MKDTTNIAGQFIGFQLDKLFPDLLWIVFWLLLFFWAKDIIKTAISTLLIRLKHGAGVKIGSFELQDLKVTAGSENQNTHFQVTNDNGGQREKERAGFYKTKRRVMLVHKMFKSQKDGQLYDFLIYLVPHKSNLIQVVSVDYYFGTYWGSKVFTTADRSNGFAIATSAYGPFLCSAKINFNDGESETIFRYIDFEMGDVAAMTKGKNE
ncbi:pYEATS domain-containing protein [Paraflavitalea sp. CAU 1676]|uniref:pYEATS domain-containing protein n=1 Tax=Paraflavitalea sp. CAU 1676 TaxID=3032598 RepID=UPI0023D98E14|nr:pYEATS domain-containing protein [Paraflavitalea sp. CAU 1676]MDF2192689.1 hypothetical protein [Paraflavitalea sp. CAU 1676]